MRSPKLIATGTATISMTPMIDVVFLLIIFFLVSSHIARQEHTIRLELPTAETGLDELVDRQRVIVNVLPEGIWLLGAVQVDQAELETALRRRLMAAQQPVQLRIRTDHSVPYERLEPILATASRVGIGDIVFSVYGERPR